MGGGAHDLVVEQASQPPYALGKEGRELAVACSACLRSHLAQLGSFRIESKKQLSPTRQDTPMPLCAVEGVFSKASFRCRAFLGNSRREKAVYKRMGWPNRRIAPPAEVTTRPRGNATASSRIL